MNSKKFSDMKQMIQRSYDVTLDVIVYGLILLMLATLIFAFVDVLADIVHLFPSLTKIKLDDAEFRDLVVSVLDVFVVIELFSIYGKHVSTEELLALAVLLVVMVVARSITGRLPPKSS